MQLNGTKIGRYTPNWEDEVHAHNNEAMASAAAYVYYKSPENAEAFVRNNMPGWDVDHDLSSPDHIVLYNTVQRQAILGYRGTELFNKSDLKADVQLATSGWDQTGNERFEQASDDYMQFMRSYGSYFNTTVTGHSLGGTQALWIAQQYPGAKAVVFNAGMVMPTGAQLLRKDLGIEDGLGQPLNNVTLIRSDGDLVSGGWMSYVNADTLKDENGRPLYSYIAHLPSPVTAFNMKRLGGRYKAGEGIKLVNANVDGNMISVHGIDNFLYDNQKTSFRNFANYLETDSEPKTNSYEPLVEPPAYHASLASSPAQMPRPIARSVNN